MIQLASKVYNRISRLLVGASDHNLTIELNAAKTELHTVKQSLDKLIRLCHFAGDHPNTTIPLERLDEILKFSKSQLGQDLFVLTHLDFKEDGFFVEFGATDGITLSNSFLLEKLMGWRGILAEPAACWQDQLKINRSAKLDFDCVWHESGKSISFRETEMPEYSTTMGHINDDWHSTKRQSGNTYLVPTVTLQELLDRHGAPEVIDYLSIDTEGSEFDILSNYTFKGRKIRIITCEHNFGINREKIHCLLSSHGYIRKFPNLSQFDDWYLLR